MTDTDFHTDTVIRHLMATADHAVESLQATGMSEDEAIVKVLQAMREFDLADLARRRDNARRAEDSIPAGTTVIQMREYSSQSDDDGSLFDAFSPEDLHGNQTRPSGLGGLVANIEEQGWTRNRGLDFGAGLDILGAIGFEAPDAGNGDTTIVRVVFTDLRP